jgi:hypothetical protein
MADKGQVLRTSDIRMVAHMVISARPCLLVKLLEDGMSVDLLFLHPYLEYPASLLFGAVAPDYPVGFGELCLFFDPFFQRCRHR